MADEEFAPRRILVAIDASPASLDALAAAAALGARLGADLAGLFVEDEELLRLAALPFARLVRAGAGRTEPLDPARAERALRAVAERARVALERAAEAEHVRATFRVTRGRVLPELLEAALGADVLALGATGEGPRAPGRVGRVARGAASRAAPAVLLLPRGGRLGERVVAIDDGAPAARRARAAAARLASPERPVVLACAGPSAEAALVERLAPWAPLVAVVPAGGPLERGDGVRKLLALGATVLLVR